MSAIVKALALGYTIPQVLQFLTKAFPSLSPRISKAQHSGYSPQQILKIIAQGLDSSGTEGMSEQQIHKARGEREGQVVKDLTKAGLTSLGGVAIARGMPAIIQGLLGQQAPQGPPTAQGVLGGQSGILPTGIPQGGVQNAQPSPSPLGAIQGTSPLNTTTSPNQLGIQQTPPTSISPHGTQASQQPPIDSSSILKQMNVEAKINNLLKAGNDPEIVGNLIDQQLKPGEKKWLDTQIQEGKARPMVEMVREYAQTQGAAAPHSIVDNAARSDLERRSPSMTSAAVNPSDLEAGRQQPLSDSQIETAVSPSRAGMQMIESPERTGPIKKSIEEPTLGEKHPVSNRTIHQKLTDINQIYKKVDESFPQFSQMLNGLKKDIPGIENVEIRKKLKETAERKIKTKGEPETISDYLGGRITVNDSEAIKSLDQKLRPLAYEVDDSITNPREDGYRATHYQIDLGNGLSAEVQVMPKEIRDVYKEAHSIYDKWKRQTTFSQKDQKEMYSDFRKMEHLYNDAWNRFQERVSRPKELAKPAKGDIVATPEGIVGDLEDVKNTEGLVKDDAGKLHKIKIKDLQQPGESVAKTVTRLLDIPEIDKSGPLNYWSYDEPDNELFIMFHNGETYKYIDVPPELVEEISKAAVSPKTKGENMYGAWSPEDKPEFSKQAGHEILSRGATMSKLIIHHPKYKKPKKGEPANPYYRQLRKGYDYFQALRGK